eukprot:364543-Chlamydomonas_euryale.AAC.1
MVHGDYIALICRHTTLCRRGDGERLPFQAPHSSAIYYVAYDSRHRPAVGGRAPPGRVGLGLPGGQIAMADDDDEQHLDRFDVENDFEGGQWIGGEFYYQNKRQKVRGRDLSSLFKGEDARLYAASKRPWRRRIRHAAVVRGRASPSAPVAQLRRAHNGRPPRYLPSQRQQTKDDQLYGVFADDSDDESRPRGLGGGRGGRKADYTQPVGFVSSGIVGQKQQPDGQDDASSTGAASFDVKGPPSEVHGGGLGFRPGGTAHGEQASSRPAGGDAAGDEGGDDEGVLSTVLGSR